MIADRHYWRTADGRFVPTGHPDGEVLAYAKGDEMPDEVANEVTKPKQVEKPATKQAAKPADK